MLKALSVDSLNLIRNACAAVGLDPFLHGLQILSADELARQHFPRLDPNMPALVGLFTQRAQLAPCARVLAVNYPPDHSVTLVARKTRALALKRLDSIAELPANAMLYIPPVSRAGSFNALAEIVAHLRAPAGCEWDRAQTHASLASALIEEAYEVVDAIERKDLPHLREELGDLLLHVLMQTHIAQDAGEFQLSEVVAEIAEKLVRRHPHVFGGVPVNGTEEILENWERIKESEKRKAESEKREAKGGKREAQSETEDIPRALPALMRAQKIAEKQKTKVDLKAVAARVEKLARAKNREKELGEALFALAAYAAEKKVDAEGALRVAIR